MAAITGLSHIGVYTPNLEGSVAFYRDLLGFRLTSRQRAVRQNGEPFDMAFIKNGTCEIELVEAPRDFAPAPGAIAHIALSVRDIDAVFRTLREAGVTCDWDAPRQSQLFAFGMRHLFFTGPAGERLELCEKA